MKTYKNQTRIKIYELFFPFYVISSYLHHSYTTSSFQKIEETAWKQQQQTSAYQNNGWNIFLYKIYCVLSLISTHRCNSVRTPWNSALPQDLGDLHYTYRERVGWYVGLCRYGVGGGGSVRHSVAGVYARFISNCAHTRFICNISSSVSGYKTYYARATYYSY